MGRRGFLVRVLARNAASLQRVRADIGAAGVYGRVSAGPAAPKRLPYADNLVNLIVVADLPDLLARGLPLAEIFRVLTPNGVALLDVGDAERKSIGAKLAAVGIESFKTVALDGGAWVRAVKPRPAEMGEWPYFSHGPDGNFVSKDLLVGPARSLRWRDAVWAKHTVNIFTGWVSAGGRMFHCVRRLAGHGHRVRYVLVARDAYNGLPIWERPVSWPIGGKYGDRNVVATADRLYLPLEPKGPIVALDAATGRTVQTYTHSIRPDQIMLADGKMLMSNWRQSRAIDLASGEKLWDNATVGGSMALADGQLLFGNAYRNRLVSLD
ncbi:hypothetical protein LCGC14_2280970, partial [marine sediment metagenome]